MHTRSTTLALTLCFAALTGCASTRSDHLAVDSPRAQIFESMGAHGRVVTTSSGEAPGYSVRIVTDG